MELWICSYSNPHTHTHTHTHTTHTPHTHIHTLHTHTSSQVEDIEIIAAAEKQQQIEEKKVSEETVSISWFLTFCCSVFIATVNMCTMAYNVWVSIPPHSPAHHTCTQESTPPLQVVVLRNHSSQYSPSDNTHTESGSSNTSNNSRSGIHDNKNTNNYYVHYITPFLYENIHENGKVHVW